MFNIQLHYHTAVKPLIIAMLDTITACTNNIKYPGDAVARKISWLPEDSFCFLHIKRFGRWK